MFQFLTMTQTGFRRLSVHQWLHRIATLTFSSLLVVIPQLFDTQQLAAEPTTRPNIILILADDHAYRDFGFMGNPRVHTPHIDKLAERSARYVNGYVPMSVCRPSLATLLTGLYPHQHGIHFNHPPPGLSTMRQLSAIEYKQLRATTNKLIESVPTLPRILSQHGYACLQTGKHWEGSFRTAGFTHGMTLAKRAAVASDITGTRPQTNGELVAHGNGDSGLVIGRKTMQPLTKFVTRYAGKQPFFVWYAPFLPHVPFDAPARFQTLFNDTEVPKHLRPYYAEIARFDETVGQLLAVLEAANVMKNTIIVFASDNGFRPHKSKHERFDDRSKLSQFEDGLRTPILIRWDGRVRSANHHQLVQTIDVVPTILAATQLDQAVTPQMQGLNLMPSASGQQSLPNRPAFGAIYPNDATALHAPSRHVRAKWVRIDQFKLIVPGPATPRILPALYDLDTDPEERHNLIDNPDFAPTVARLTAAIENWWPVGDDSRCTPALQ